MHNAHHELHDRHKLNTHPRLNVYAYAGHGMRRADNELAAAIFQ